MSIQHINICGFVAKAMLTGKCAASNAYTRKEKSLKTIFQAFTSRSLNK